jgi:hypothetical protein
MSGRKPRQESRATELRRILIEWEQAPESSRPSLRSLACELGTSHQLLAFFLKGLDEWRGQQYLREASQIRSVASAEGRQLTEWEEQRAYACTRAGVQAIAGAMLRSSIARMRKESERRALCRQEIKSLTMLARQFPEAQELLQKCSPDGLKKRKRFAEIVKKTPRADHETIMAWVRRIWDQCSIYDTNCPKVLTEELLERYSQASARNQKNNLPVTP